MNSDKKDSKKSLRQGQVVSIVVPAFNEEKNLEHLYQSIVDVFKNQECSFELLIVENGSSDKSLSILKKLHSENEHVHFLSLSRNFGHQGALVAGLEAARGDAVITMDADLQHPPELIPEILKFWEEGYDVVYTIKRQNCSQNLIRRFFDRAYYSILYLLTGIELYGRSDYRLLDRQAVDVIKNMPERNKFLRGLTHWIGFKQIGIYYDVQCRHKGISKFTIRQLFRLAVDGIFSFSIIPLRLFIFVGGFAAMCSIVYAMYIFCLKLYSLYFEINGELLPSGWTSLIFGLLFLGGVQLIGIGLLGEYLGRVYDEVKRRPNYIIKETSIKQ